MIGTPDINNLYIKGPTKADAWFELSLTPIYTVIDPGGSSYITEQDMDKTIHTEATILTEGQVFTRDFVPSELSENMSFSSVTPEIGSVDTSGLVKRVIDGNVGVVVTTRWIKRRYDVPVLLVIGATQTITTGFTSGSLGENISDSIDLKITDVTAENLVTKKPIFSTINHSTGTYVRSTACWAYGLDLTPISPYNTRPDLGTGQYFASVLISPRHVIGADHWFPFIGNTIRFVASDNSIVDRVLMDKIRIGTTDIIIGVLDSDVPASISFAKFLPTDWISYMPGISFSVPVLYTDQEEKALIGSWNYNMGTSVNLTIYPPASSFDKRLLLWEGITGGDSGSAFFSIVNGELAVMMCVYSGTTSRTTGPNLVKYHTEINAAMTTLGGGYQLTEIDLSSFPTY